MKREAVITLFMYYATWLLYCIFRFPLRDVTLYIQIYLNVALDFEFYVADFKGYSR